MKKIPLASNPITLFLSLLKEGVEAWKVYLEKRGGILKDKRIRRLKRATNEAERLFREVEELIEFIKPFVMERSKEDVARFNRLVAGIRLLKRRFDKFD